MVSMFFTTLFQDDPICANFGTCPDGNPGTSIAYAVFYIWENALDILLDVAILCLPIPVIRSLNLSGNKRRTLIAIFALGGL